MNDIVYTQLIKDVRVFTTTKEGSRLLFVHVTGYSERGKPGLPVLIRKKGEEQENPELAEFDFMVCTREESSQEDHLEWEVNEVWYADSFNQELKAIKIIALENADIALVEQL